MASISPDPRSKNQDCLRLMFWAPDGRQATIRLGRMDEYRAGLWKTRIEDLLTCLKTGDPMHPDTRLWLSRLPDGKHRQLVHYGLADARQQKAAATGAGPTVKEWVDQYTASRADVKESTRTVYTRTAKHLCAHFGPDKRLAEVHEGDADAFRLYLLKVGLAENTVRRTIGICQQLWRAALRSKVVTVNPFLGIKATVRGNEAKQHYIDRETALKIMEHMPLEWQAIFGLARFAGFRTPSETLALRWADVRFDEDKMRVTCVKTAHAGKESRWVPIVPELRPILLALYAEASEGTLYVVTRYRSTAVNLRQQLERYMDKAGIDPWPKLFVNLRSSCATDWVKEYGPHLACAWLGHGLKIAQEHYWQVRDEDFKKAAGEWTTKRTTQAQADSSEGDTTQAADPTEGIENEGELAYASAGEGEKGGDWAMQDSNLRPSACKADALAD